MRELLTAAVRVGGVTHLVGPVTMVLQGGPRFVYFSENNEMVWSLQKIVNGFAQRKTVRSD